MLRIVNPVHGAMMVTNPARRRKRGLRKGYRFKGLLPKARARRKGASRSTFAFGEKSMIRLHSTTRRKGGKKRGGYRRRRKNQEMGMVDTTPARKLLPDTKELTGDASTLLVGVGAFMLNHAVGQGVNKLVSMSGMGDKLGGAMGVVKFAARYLGARALSAYVFKESKGVLSKDNGVFVKNIITISAGVALANDFGLREKLPAAVQPYWPNLAGYESGIRPGQLSRARHYRKVLSGYDSGVRRAQLSSYTSTTRADLSGGVNFDNMPTEGFEVSNYGIPFGA